MTRRSVGLVLISLVLAARLQGQAATCTGLNVVDPGPSAMLVNLDIVRDGGEWRLVHARLNRLGANQGTVTSGANGELTFVINALGSEYHGSISSNGRLVRGSWTAKGRTIPLNLRCTPVPASAPDSSPHKTQFVAVAPGVRLEVLDWGGTGRSVVLLHGMAATAHDFDAFAPKLVSDYHVYAITRRGSGRSSAPDSGYSSDRLGDDVLAVIDSLRLRDPILVGHSFAGAQLSSVGSRFPGRVAGLVYLDAAVAYAYVDTSREDPFGLGKEGGWLCPCSLSEQLNMGMRAYRGIPVPILAIYAVNASWEVDDGMGWTNATQAREFELGVPTARVVRLPNADHYVFRSNEADVLRAIRPFISSLPRHAP